MSVIDKIRAKAAADVKHVVLAEGTEPRTVQAAEKIVKLGLAKITLVGAKAEIEAKAAELGVDLTGVSIADPATSEKTASYAEQLFHIREKKGMTLEKATELCLKNTLFYGTMMLKMGDADAMVAGAINTTGDVLRPALQIIKGAPGIKTVSSCFLMEVQDKKYGDDGVLVFGDCAVNIDPDQRTAGRHRDRFRADRQGAAGHRPARGDALLLHEGLCEARERGPRWPECREAGA